MGKNTTAMEAFQHPVLYDFGQQVVDQAYSGTLNFARAAATFSRLTETYSAGSWDSWKAVFGGGDEVEGRILGPVSYQVTWTALFRTGLLPPEMYKEKDIECKNATTGAMLFEEQSVRHKIRRTSYIYKSDLLHRLPNIIIAPLQPLLLVFAPTCARRSTRRHTALGAAMLIFVVASWPFATAVSAVYGEVCELRLLTLFGAPVKTMILQTLERAAYGSTAALLVQSIFLCLSHLGLANTGLMPSRIQLPLVVSGVVMAIFVGFRCTRATWSCTSPYSLSTLDMYGPLLVAAGGLGLALNGLRITRPLVLWEKFNVEEIKDDRIGLALGIEKFGITFYVTVKQGPVLLQYAFGDKINVVPVEDFSGRIRRDSLCIRCMKYHICERSSQTRGRSEELELLIRDTLRQQCGPGLHQLPEPPRPRHSSLQRLGRLLRDVGFFGTNAVRNMKTHGKVWRI